MAERKKPAFWVVFYRPIKGRVWRPTSAHLKRPDADRAYWAQINDGPPGGHMLRKFDTPKAYSR